jgi:NAD(P)-dependent dehydrogenase (short-subunit alcohol dehydrogenase family)
MAANGTSPTGAVVITGASTGIGRACALRMDRMGWRVFAGVRRQQDADALVAEASARLTPVMIDVTDAASIEAAARQVAHTLGSTGLAGLVNNAGVGFGGPLEFLPIQDLRQQLEVNVVGQVAVTQAFLPLLRRARGRIVFMGSIGGRLATPFLGPYNASKFAIEAITDALRGELRPWGLHVAVVEPGSIATPIWEKSRSLADRLEREMPPEAQRLYGAHIDAIRRAVDEAEGRGIPPDAVAKAVAHALTAKRPKTRYIVGRDARIQAIASAVLPDRLMDRVVAAQMHLPKEVPASTADEPARETASTR